MSNSKKKCKDCIPQVGTIGFRLDIVPPKKPHYPFAGNHVHVYEMRQSPAPLCKCFWHSQGVQSPPPPAGAIPITPAGGGGLT